MAYEIKYRITTASKSNVNSIVYLYEDAYAGSIIEYQATSLQLEYIPSSDDTFEPIYVSQLSLTIDVTDNIANMPNFTTLDDRKYFVRVVSGGVIDFQGWALSDDVQFSFNTGRKELSFNALDGLGMLERIRYDLPNTIYLTQVEKAIILIKDCLLKLEYPFDYDIISGISFYAEGMTNRTSSLNAEPLNQTYINFATIVNENQETLSCLEILTMITKSFGARLFQANGNWYIVSLTQFAQESYYATIYNSDATVSGNAVYSIKGIIQGYTNNTSGLYFVDNSQFKLIRKGYNKIRFEKKIEHPSNYATNWDLKIFEYVSPTVSNAFGWTQVRNGGTNYVKTYPNRKYNSFILDYSGTTSPFYVSVSPNNLPNINSSDTINISFDFAGLGAPAGGPTALFILKIQVNPTSGPSFFLDNNKTWKEAVNSLDHYYFEPFNPADVIANVSVETPVCPVSGQLVVELILGSGTVTYWKSTIGSGDVSNFNIKLNSNFLGLTTESYITNTDEYVQEIDLPMGFNDSMDGKYNYKGFLSDSTGTNLKNWYRQEFPTDIYRSLSELVVKQYSNCLNKNIINLDAAFMGMQTTTNGRFSGAMPLRAVDTDPAQISVNDKRYILGNSNIDLPNDVITATLLEINPNNISSTLTTIYDSNPLSTVVTGFGHFRSNGFLTKEAAYAATLTSNLVYLDQAGVPSIGDFFYQNEFLFVGFNGANIWWKVLVTDSYFQAYRISGAGEILETYG
jgi:hypothetical protein